MNPRNHQFDAVSGMDEDQKRTIAEQGRLVRTVVQMGDIEVEGSIILETAGDESEAEKISDRRGFDEEVVGFVEPEE